MMAMVLVVDDSPADALDLRDSLELVGHAVYIVRDGGEGIKLSIDALPELIMMNFSMPFMMEFLAVRKFRRNGQTKNIPIVRASRDHFETGFEWTKVQGVR